MVPGILTQPYRALILDEEEEYEEVIVATSEALRDNPHLLHRLGQRLQAISDYDVAIRLDPDFRRTREDRQRAGAGLPPVA